MVTCTTGGNPQLKKLISEEHNASFGSMETTLLKKLIYRYSSFACMVKKSNQCSSRLGCKIPSHALQLNGINTQGENIADNGGIKEAYQAYQSWIDRNGPEKVINITNRGKYGSYAHNASFTPPLFIYPQKLPGLKYTPNQLFWISAANVWCNKYRPESLKLRILTGVHSPGEFRVVGPLSNMKQFSKDFNCPAKSGMNAENKCYVW